MANAMKTTSDRSLDSFLRTLEQTSKIVSAIRPDQWQNATPCAEWDMTVLVNHITGENHWLAAVFSGETVAGVGDRFDGDLVGDNPIQAYLASIELAKASITPEMLEAHHGVSFGDISGHDYVSQLFMDQLVHGWDAMMGSRQTVELDDELTAAAIPVAKEMVAYVGQGSVFGNTLDIGTNAADLEALLGELGRSLAWQPPEGAVFK
ncbi:MAG: TIGR03086 family metal-binding protein [Chloroflexi bacterium]|nr:TIGR03086 family metal-binding protein [Chloroflexota bacterium]MDA1173773.1 TIGR03086 family metal-binding protein [Chloroflexota bacterium]